MTEVPPIRCRDRNPHYYCFVHKSDRSPETFRCIARKRWGALFGHNSLACASYISEYINTNLLTMCPPNYCIVYAGLPDCRPKFDPKVRTKPKDIRDRWCKWFPSLWQHDRGFQVPVADLRELQRVNPTRLGFGLFILGVNRFRSTNRTHTRSHSNHWNGRWIAYYVGYRARKGGPSNLAIRLVRS
jgi:hypothetical protein